MSSTVEAKSEPSTKRSFPGALALRRALSLLVTALFAAFVCSALLTGSKGGGLGNTSTAVNATLGPNPLLYVCFGLIVFGGITWAIRRAADEAGAVKILNRATVVVAVFAALAIVIGDVWFFSVPPDHWLGPGFIAQPFPFATVHVTTTPLN